LIICRLADGLHAGATARFAQVQHTLPGGSTRAPQAATCYALNQAARNCARLHCLAPTSVRFATKCGMSQDTFVVSSSLERRHTNTAAPLHVRTTASAQHCAAAPLAPPADPSPYPQAAGPPALAPCLWLSAARPVASPPLRGRGRLRTAWSACSSRGRGRTPCRQKRRKEKEETNERHPSFCYYQFFL
jgi:hypothetical protein